MSDFEVVVTYCKEYKREHLNERGLRAFQHPNAKSAIIVTEGESVLGYTLNTILKDNAHTNYVIREKAYKPFTY